MPHRANEGQQWQQTDKNADGIASLCEFMLFCYFLQIEIGFNDLLILTLISVIYLHIYKCKTTLDYSK